jgi:Holliday junction DNA helicase RuvA
MIGYLHGRLLNKNAESLLILVGGVGYQLECPASTIWALPRAGDIASLYVSMVVREDAIRLFGFAHPMDKVVFETLIGVSSVGPKLALALMGSMSGSDLVLALHARDETRLLSVPGVGQRKLEKLLVEIGPKLDKLWALCQNASSGSSAVDFVDGASTAQNAAPTDGPISGHLGGSNTPFADAAPNPKAMSLQTLSDQRKARRELLADLESALTNIGHRDKFIRPCLDWVERQWNDGLLQPELETSLRAILQRQSARLVTGENDNDTAPRLSTPSKSPDLWTETEPS